MVPEDSIGSTEPADAGDRKLPDQEAGVRPEGTPAAASDFLPDSDVLDGPSPGMNAFISDTREAILTRCAQLLLLGQSLGGEELPSEDEGRLAQEQQKDRSDLGLPALSSLPTGDTAGRTISSLHEQAGKSLSWDSDMPGHEGLTTVRLWDRMEANEDTSAALALIFRQLNSQHLAVRVAAASALSGLAPMDPTIRAILLEGMRSSDATVRTVAGMALVDDDRDQRRTDITRGRNSNDRAGRGRQRQASLTVHGTFAGLPSGRKDNPWHRPGDPLHRHVLNEVDLGLFRDRYFRWSGAYSKNQRADATKGLIRWADVNSVDCFDVIYAHSHGGNVVMSAAAEGLRVRVLVLMHVPILPRPAKEWEKIAQNVSRVIQLKTRCDWVVIADRSGQKIPRVLQHTVPSTGPLGAWFSHNFYTQVETWEDRDLASLVSYEHNLSSDPVWG